MNLPIDETPGSYTQQTETVFLQQYEKYSFSLRPRKPIIASYCELFLTELKTPGQRQQKQLCKQGLRILLKKKHESKQKYLIYMCADWVLRNWPQLPLLQLPTGKITAISHSLPAYNPPFSAFPRCLKCISKAILSACHSNHTVHSSGP